jgi:hypothetical protein
MRIVSFTGIADTILILQFKNMCTVNNYCWSLGWILQILFVTALIFRKINNGF